MRIKVTLIQKDLLNHEENIIADGPALLNGNKLVYTEKDSTIRHTVTYEPEKLVLERSGEFPSRTVLKEGRISHSVVDSPYGQMVMNTRLKNRSRSETLWFAEYQVLSDGEVVLEQQLLWKFSSLN